jgi:hypothetical protein
LDEQAAALTLDRIDAIAALAERIRDSVQTALA